MSLASINRVTDRVRQTYPFHRAPRIGLQLFSGMIRGRRSYEVRRGREQSTSNTLKSAGHGAVFVTENSTVVVAQIGGTAKLPCVVRKFSNGVVSFKSVLDTQKDSPPTILTVGVGTYIADDRFLVEHARHLQNWGLVIKHVRPADAGLYECQVSTHPTSSILIELKVTEASAEIIGAPDMHIRAGSLLRLVCTLRHSTEPPEYVFWYQEQRMINHDPGVSVTADRASSVLQLEEADTSHSGNYTCYPSNAIPAYINVHVLNATEGYKDYHDDDGKSVEIARITKDNKDNEDKEQVNRFLNR
ncbi:hypothetical protein NQ317_011483 [Molorchus minor]|uniref:Ig-like domain-containing protein n=1 Tax=Molorchus minor TaxID=1323400 RepID=A0ABQ9J466_9CUCU|nr:hypothetical protein NQ317_011483 [Molorchus minor]